MPAQSASEFFSSIPLITKYIVGTAVVMSCVTSGAMSPASFIMVSPIRFQFWRFLTAALYFGPLSFPTIINLMMFLQYSKQMEEEHFKGRAADYVWCLTLGWMLMMPIGYMLGMPIMSLALIMYMVYIWCNMNPRQTLSLMFIPIQIPSIYFPWALAALNFALRRSFWPELIGIIIGHLYYFFAEEYPARYKKQIIKTPSFLLDIFPPSKLTVQGFTAPGRTTVGQQQQQVRNPFGAHRWGGGRRLGNT